MLRKIHNKIVFVICILSLGLLCKEQSLPVRKISQFRCLTIEAKSVYDNSSEQAFPIFNGTLPELTWTRDMEDQFGGNGYSQLCITVRPGAMRQTITDLIHFYQQTWVRNIDFDRPGIYTLEPGPPCLLTERSCRIRKKYPPDLYASDTEPIEMDRVSLYYASSGKTLTVYVPIVPGDRKISRWQDLDITESGGAGWPPHPDSRKDSLLLIWTIGEESNP